MANDYNLETLKKIVGDQSEELSQPDVGQGDIFDVLDGKASKEKKKKVKAAVGGGSLEWQDDDPVWMSQQASKSDFHQALETGSDREVVKRATDSLTDPVQDFIVSLQTNAKDIQLKGIFAKKYLEINSLDKVLRNRAYKELIKAQQEENVNVNVGKEIGKFIRANFTAKERMVFALDTAKTYMKSIMAFKGKNQEKASPAAKTSNEKDSGRFI